MITEIILQDPFNHERNKRLEELKSAAMPLIKYLADNHHPHVSAKVTSTSVELVEGVMNIPNINDFIKD